MKRYVAYLDGPNGRVHIANVYATTEEQVRAQVAPFLVDRPENHELRILWQEAGSPVRLDPIY